MEYLKHIGTSTAEVTTRSNENIRNRKYTMYNIK